MPQLCRQGAALIWTRHRQPSDLTPAIRGWLADAGFVEEAFVSPGPGGFAVGAARLDRPPDPLERSATWFAFTR
jgi:hypothetical protein